MEQLRTLRSGTWLVAGIFAFGFALTGALYAYWTLSTAPFHKLSVALAEQYPGSAPRVDGGKPRLDRPGEQVLRIVMKSPFDLDDPSAAKRFSREVATFAAQTQNIGDFDVIQVHLFRENPERELSQLSVRIRVEVLAPRRDNGQPR